jgi:hypothetical protein
MNQFEVNSCISDTFDKFNEAYQILLILRTVEDCPWLGFYVLNDIPNPFEPLKKLSELEFKVVPISEIFNAYKQLVEFDRNLLTYISEREKADGINCKTGYHAGLYGVSDLCSNAVALMENAINYNDDIAA